MALTNSLFCSIERKKIACMLDFLRVSKCWANYPSNLSGQLRQNKKNIYSGHMEDLEHGANLCHICSLTLRASHFGNASCVTDVWNPIESRQFIGWWRDATPDALTSSAHIGERAIYSSDFSAFTKRSYCPSVLRFFWPKYHISNVNYPFALRRLPTVELCSPCGEVPWSIAAINHRARDSSLAMTHTVSVLSVWGFHMHAKRFMESQNVHFVRISVS